MVGGFYLIPRSGSVQLLIASIQSAVEVISNISIVENRVQWVLFLE